MMMFQSNKNMSMLVYKLIESYLKFNLQILLENN